MNAEQEKLLEAFEDFELDLEVEEILANVKKECVLDEGVSEFGQLLEEERKRLKQAAQGAQGARATYVRDHWTPGHYPQLTCEWFVEGLDYCCPYWPSNTTASTAAISRYPHQKTADAGTVADPQSATHKATTTTLTMTTTNSRRSWTKKPDDGCTDGLPEPGTGPGIPTEWPPLKNSIRLDIQTKWPPRDDAIGRSIGRKFVRPRDGTITLIWNSTGPMINNAANRNTDGRGWRNIERNSERPPP